jgi:3-dehydroquinate synthase
MTRVTLSVPGHGYDAVIEAGLLERTGDLLRQVLGPKRKLFIVTVPPVRRKWGRPLMSSLTAAGLSAEFIEMEEGETYKRMGTIENLAEKLIALGADRNAVFVAFGGGVVGDVTGFLASIYLRGVDVVQIPTTFLAQVDSSVGGKTGVNLRAGKNLVGTFHHPRVVVIDPTVLSTLSEREFRAGLFESWKCGIIGLPEVFDRLEKTSLKALRKDSKTLEWVIAQSVKLKADVVSSDEKENGLRRVLNLGHTIGHALEAETSYRHFLHGEAVAWGMVAAANIAAAVRKLDAASAQRISDAVLSGGPLPGVEVPSRNILRRLQADKKTRDGVVHFVLPRKIGEVEIVNDVPQNVVLQAVDHLRRLSS